MDAEPDHDAGDPAATHHAGPNPPAAVRDLVQYAAVVAGAVLLLLGWYGISGTAHIEQQMPYLASASLPGTALVVAGAVLIAGDRSRRANDRATHQVEVLYSLLTTAVEGPATAAGSSATTTLGTGTDLYAVGGGNRYHRGGCALVAGKSTAEVVDAAAIDERGLEPCPLCEPTRPTR